MEGGRLNLRVLTVKTLMMKDLLSCLTVTLNPTGCN